MKHTYYILLALYAVVFASFSSCKRRPLTTADYKVIVNIEIEEDIVNYKMPQDRKSVV